MQSSGILLLCAEQYLRKSSCSLRQHVLCFFLYVVFSPCEAKNDIQGKKFRARDCPIEWYYVARRRRAAAHILAQVCKRFDAETAALSGSREEIGGGVGRV